MLKPPPLPASALIAGKVAVGATWLGGLAAFMIGAGGSSLHNIGFWIIVFLFGSHVLELLIYGAFLKAARATTADYVQVFLFGIFHSGGMKAD
jgi:uncharacterized protein YhhL (DUF1145 family)